MVMPWLKVVDVVTTARWIVCRCAPPAVNVGDVGESLRLTPELATPRNKAWVEVHSVAVLARRNIRWILDKVHLSALCQVTQLSHSAQSPSRATPGCPTPDCVSSPSHNTQHPLKATMSTRPHPAPDTNPATVSTRRVAVVTGGARGIGLAIVQWFLDRDHAVAILDWDADQLAQTEAALQAPERVYGHVCDVSDPSSVSECAQSVWARFGRIDALVNNAGVAIFKPIQDTSFEEWRHVMAVNLDGAFLCTQAFAPLMQRGEGGAVVNISSISGLRASTLRVAYGTSKAALIHLTKQQAVEYGAFGVRVNCVAPGPVETEMAKRVHSAAIRQDYQDNIPLNRYGTPEEIAEAVGFLCSAGGGYVNGQVLSVDGGFEAMGVGLPTLRKEAGHR